MTQTEAVGAGNPAPSSQQKRATLDAGRKKLEEFRKKKEAQALQKQQQAKLEEVQPILAEKTREREEELKQQVTDLLTSVDDLHRSLNDERYNSSQLEGTISALRRELADEVGKKTQLDGRVAELEGELVELMGQLEALVKEREESLESATQVSSKEDITRYQSRIAALEAELEAAQAQQRMENGREKEIEELTKRLDQLVAEKEVMMEASARSEAELQSLLTAKETFKARIASLEAEVALAKENANDSGDMVSSTDAAEMMGRLDEVLKEKEELLHAKARLASELADASSLAEESVNQKERAEQKLDEATRRIEELEVVTATADAAVAAAKKSESHLGEELATLRAQHATLKSKVHNLESTANASGQKDERLATLSSELERVKNNLAAEKRRSTQLEQLVASSSAGNKKLDDDQDMEAAALAGGSAFKPLVGVIRSLPPVLGNNAFVNEAAKKLDKASVALDARPVVRAAVIGYMILLHVILLI